MAWREMNACSLTLLRYIVRKNSCSIKMSKIGEMTNGCARIGRSVICMAFSYPWFFRLSRCSTNIRLVKPNSIRGSAPRMYSCISPHFYQIVNSLKSALIGVAERCNDTALLYKVRLNESLQCPAHITTQCMCRKRKVQCLLLDHVDRCRRDGHDWRGKRTLLVWRRDRIEQSKENRLSPEGIL